MLKIKLSQRGKKHQRSYRIVIAEARSKRDGKFVDDLGFYNPQEKKLVLNKEKFTAWQAKGAQLSDGVRRLLEEKKNETTT